MYTEKLRQTKPESQNSAAQIMNKLTAFLTEEDKNLLQQVFTLPNAISATSFTCVYRGAEKMGTPEGLYLMAGGRLGDLADGFFARLLQQSSQLGAVTDSLLDKASMAKIILEAWKRNAVPKEQLAAIASTQVLNFGATAVYGLQGPEKTWRPTKAGKLGITLDNMCLISHVAAYTLEQLNEQGGEYGNLYASQLTRASELLRTLGDSSFAAARPLSAVATGSYLEQCIPPTKRTLVTAIGAKAIGLAVPLMANLLVKRGQR